ncbi:MAG TPA: lysophospholipid acyltransferase family protein, partial [Pyrinomonadaceae bacterium]
MNNPEETQAKGTNGAGPKRVEMALPQWAISLIRPVIGFGSRMFWQLEHKGLENIPPNGGLIVAANHQSYGDPFWLAQPIKRPIRFLAWSEAFSWPVVGRTIRWLGAWPLQVSGSDPAAIRRSLTWLRDGGVVVIFPEGERGQADGSMIRMKAGAVRMALEAGVPILPVTVRGGNQVWPASKLLPRPGKVEIIYHLPFTPEPLPGEET